MTLGQKRTPQETQRQVDRINARSKEIDKRKLRKKTGIKENDNVFWDFIDPHRYTHYLYIPYLLVVTLFYENLHRNCSAPYCATAAILLQYTVYDHGILSVNFILKSTSPLYTKTCQYLMTLVWLYFTQTRFWEFLAFQHKDDAFIRWLLRLSVAGISIKIYWLNY